MSNILTVQHSVNFARTYIEYAPLTAGFGLEPAASIGSMIKNGILNPPMTYNFNRAETSFVTVAKTQDYTETIADLWFVEKVTLVDDQGNSHEIKDVYNNAPLAPSANSLYGGQRPSGLATLTVSGTTYTFRFIGVPTQVYTVTITYQKLAPQIGPFFITSCQNASGGNTTYVGTFDVNSFPAGATAIITGFTNALNNGSFTVVSCSDTALVLVNAAGVAAAATAFANNFSWAPIPDNYSDVYNNLFLSEALASVDDARSQLYRQRGVAAMLSKDNGLTDTQKNIFMQQWLQRGIATSGAMMTAQMGTQGRGQ